MKTRRFLTPLQDIGSKSNSLGTRDSQGISISGTSLVSNFSVKEHCASLTTLKILKLPQVAEMCMRLARERDKGPFQLGIVNALVSDMLLTHVII